MSTISIYRGNKDSNQILININKKVANILGVPKYVYFDELNLTLTNKQVNGYLKAKVNYRYYWVKKKFYDYGNITVSANTPRINLIGKWEYTQQNNQIKLTKRL